MKRICATISLILCIPLLMINCSDAAGNKIEYPSTAKHPVKDIYHGVEITDNYRWLENSDDQAVQAWTEDQENMTHSVIDNLPQMEYLTRRFNQLWRYDQEDVPERVLEGDRLFYWSKLKDQEKWIYNTKANEDADPVVLIDPNQWNKDETLSSVVPSRDGKYLAFGKARGGDENSVYQVMEVASGRILPDRLKGWKQGVSSWLPGNEGFLYSAQPKKGDVPEGEENYWEAVYYHKLGTAADEDTKLFWHDDVKEYWHYAAVTEDGRHIVFYRGEYYKYQVFLKKIDSSGEIIPIADDFDAIYNVDIVEDKIFIHTNKDAPLNMVYVTDIDKPGPEHWKIFIPEHKNDKLSYIVPADGRIYASYKHNAYTQIRIYSFEGAFLRDIEFPTIGTASLSGVWSQSDVWIEFSSFTYPATTFKYDYDSDNLSVYWKFPPHIDLDNVVASQVWYKSKDGTPVSMFLVHSKDLVKNGDNPVYLYGYGGFNISMNPRFSTSYAVWLEAGGMIAIPNLRGGGEYGEEWHEAGMLDKKQNVFDDFIAAAEWLIANKYTNPEKLAIAGGSNGGLLVGAVMVQRPELFKVVECEVPLLDMLIYHKFGYSNVWANEYGSSDDPEGFNYIRAYSPYQNVVDGADYPAIIITGSENDARTDPLHARKMTARLQEANPNGEPILLLVRKSSGHHGGTTLSTQIRQRAEVKAFIMEQLGMKTPE